MVARAIYVCSCRDCRKDRNSLAAKLHGTLNRLLARADEKQRRWTAAWEAMKLGRGGILRVSEITGISRRTISRGIKELTASGAPIAEERVRRSGGGRRSIEKKRSRHPPGSAGVDGG